MKNLLLLSIALLSFSINAQCKKTVTKTTTTTTTTTVVEGKKCCPTNPFKAKPKKKRKPKRYSYNPPTKNWNTSHCMYHGWGLAEVWHGSHVLVIKIEDEKSKQLRAIENKLDDIQKQINEKVTDSTDVNILLPQFQRTK